MLPTHRATILLRTATPFARKRSGVDRSASVRKTGARWRRDQTRNAGRFAKGRSLRAASHSARGQNIASALLKANDQREEREAFDQGGRDNHGRLNVARDFRLPSHALDGAAGQPSDAEG